MGFCKRSSIFKINGQAIFEPAPDLQIEYESVSDSGSGRTLDGVMHNIFVRESVAKVSLVYPVMSQEEIQEMLSLVQGKEFNFTYPDLKGGIRTAKFYVAKSGGRIYSSVLYGGLYRDVTFNCIEV